MMPTMETANPTTRGGAKRRRFTESERSEHLIAWERSGLSARDYAADHGLSVASLYSWSKKKRSDRREPVSGSSFVPVRIAPGGFCGSGLRVTLKGQGLECIIEGADGPEDLVSLTSALKREVFGV